MNHKRIVLFLDFDGVLHPRFPASGDEMFRALPLFNDALRGFYNLNIVISSSWRHDPRDLAWALKLFPPELSSRVLGTTPLMGGKTKREQEILAWLESAAEKPELVVVLDDEPDLFLELRSHVFAVDGTTGIVLETIAGFKNWLANQ